MLKPQGGYVCVCEISNSDTSESYRHYGPVVAGGHSSNSEFIVRYRFYSVFMWRQRTPDNLGCVAQILARESRSYVRFSLKMKISWSLACRQKCALMLKFAARA